MDGSFLFWVFDVGLYCPRTEDALRPKDRRQLYRCRCLPYRRSQQTTWNPSGSAPSSGSPHSLSPIPPAYMFARSLIYTEPEHPGRSPLWSPPSSLSVGSSRISKVSGSVDPLCTDLSRGGHRNIWHHRGKRDTGAQSHRQKRSCILSALSPSAYSPPRSFRPVHGSFLYRKVIYENLNGL